LRRMAMKAMTTSGTATTAMMIQGIMYRQRTVELNEVSFRPG
jgi:hypothetical protein